MNLIVLYHIHSWFAT